LTSLYSKNTNQREVNGRTFLCVVPHSFLVENIVRRINRRKGMHCARGLGKQSWKLQIQIQPSKSSEIWDSNCGLALGIN